MYLIVVFSFGILNIVLKFSITLEPNSLDPVHIKLSTCSAVIFITIITTIYCFVSICRVTFHILILWHLIFEIPDHLESTMLWMQHKDLYYL